MAVVSTAGRCTNEIEYVERSEIRLHCIAPRICVLCERNALGSGKASASEHCSSHTVGPSKPSASQFGGDHALGSGKSSASQLDGSHALGSGEASASQPGSGHAVGPGKPSASQPSGSHAMGPGKSPASSSRLIIRFVYHAGPTSMRWAFCVFTAFNEKT
jgi:hypothetical protein